MVFLSETESHIRFRFFLRTKSKSYLQLGKKVVLLRKILAMDSVILGTELKYAIELISQGFSMDEDDFTIYIMKGRNIVKEYAKSDLRVENGTYLLCINTEEIGLGSFDVAAKAEVPDDHFPDGFRTEIERVQVFNVKKL